MVEFGITDNSGVLSYSGTNSTVAPASAGLVQPSGLTFGTSSGDTGNLYVANSAGADVVEITGATGSSPTPSVFVAPGSGGLEFPTGVVWQNGSLYVIDLGAFDGAGKVLTYDSSGSYIGNFVPAVDLEGQYHPTVSSMPRGIC